MYFKYIYIYLRKRKIDLIQNQMPDMNSLR